MADGLRRETLLYGLSTVVSGLVMLAFLPFMSEWLDPAEAGESGVLRITAEVFAGIAVLGLPVGIVRLWSRDGVSKRAVVIRAASGTVAAAAILGAAAFLLSPWLRSELSISTPSGLLHACLLGTGAALVQVALTFHRADGRAGSYFWVQAARGLLSLALLPLLLLAGAGGVNSFLAARWVPAMLAAATAILVALRFAGPSPGSARGLLRYSLPLVPAGLAMLVLSSADMMMLRSMAPDLLESGYYEWSSSACMALTPLTIGFGMAWHRRVFGAAGQPGGLARLGRQALAFIVVLEAAALLLALSSRELVELVGGPGYSGAARVLPILAGSAALYGVFIVAQTGPLLSGRTWQVSMATFIGAFGNIVFNYRLIPLYGASGAALATLGTNLFMAASLFWTGRAAFPANAPLIALVMAVPAAMGPVSTLSLPLRATIAVAWTAGSALLCRALLREEAREEGRDA